MRASWPLIVLLTVSAGLAEQPTKPACSSSNRGEMWPARDQQESAAQVEMCTYRRWRYRWERVTVSYSQLIKDAERKGKLVAPRHDVPDRGSASRLPEAATDEAASERVEVVSR